MSFEAMFLYALETIVQPPVYDTIAAAQLTLRDSENAGCTLRVCSNRAGLFAGRAARRGLLLPG